jgi:Na+/melibiose symporter-like transporter
MIGLWQTGANTAVLIGACVDQGTHLMKTRWSYRIPLLVQIFFPCVLSSLAFFIPETPSEEQSL